MPNATNLTALAAKSTADNGGEFAMLLQPKNRRPFVAITTPTAAEVTAIRDALVAVGIMKSS